MLGPLGKLKIYRLNFVIIVNFDFDENFTVDGLPVEQLPFTITINKYDVTPEFSSLAIRANKAGLCMI